MEELFQDIKYYIDLRIKRFKLNMVDNLSAFCSRAISLTAFLLMLLLAHGCARRCRSPLDRVTYLGIRHCRRFLSDCGVALLSASGQALYRRYGEDVQQDVFREQF